MPVFELDPGILATAEPVLTAPEHELELFSAVLEIEAELELDPVPAVHVLFHVPAVLERAVLEPDVL